MNENVRQGLGILAVAAMCLLVAVMAAVNDSDTLAGITRGIGTLAALLGLAYIAYGLLGRRDDD